jgi:hypothetical protein
LNCQAERAFRDKVQAKHPTLEGEDLDNKVLELGKKKQYCTSDAETRKAVIELFMLHLEWHPLIYLDPTETTAGPTLDVQDAWRNQTMEMYQLCEGLGEAWVWEYLWKNWYRPSRWVIWARAISSMTPIAQSNAAVESLWSVLKKGYLRKHSRPKMEFLIHIIMDQFMPARIELIGEHRKFRRIETPQVPPWYSHCEHD